MHAFFSCFSRFHTESIHFYAPHPSPRPHATIAYQALRPDIKMAFAKSIVTMPMFTRSRSRGDRDRDPTSKKWLSGISVGNWSLGLSFEDEEEELVNTSNAVMIDRSEPAISWKAQVLLAKSKFEAGDNLVTSKEEEEEEKEERGNSDNDNLVSSLSKDSSRPEVTVKDFEVKEPISSKSTVSDCLLARNSGEASELLSDGLQSAISTTANTGAAENGQADLMTDHQDREFSINGIDSPAKFSDRCVAVAGGRPGGSKGPLKAGIIAKASQGFEGGSPRSPIGMPLNTPTQLSYTRNKDKAGSEGNEGDETMSFFNSHTTTGQSDPKKGSPVQKKHGGGDSATHAAVFSSSRCITDNGSSFSKDTGTSTCTWSLAAVDCGSSVSSSRTVPTTPSATPFPAIPTSPTGHGASHKVGSVLLLDTTSPASSTAASPIEICATTRESLQPQVQVPVPKEYHPQGPTSVSGPVSPQSASEGVNEVVRPVTASSSSTSLSAGSLGSFNTHLSPITPTTQSGNLSSSISTSTSPGIFTMAARSAAAQKSLKRSGAARDQYSPFASKHTSYASPPPLMDTAPSSSNSSQEFQIQNDIHTLQTAARQREQAEVGHRGRARARADSGSRMQGSYVKGHGKSGSGGNEILESVFGIYPEKKSMGTGVSVADVVASKLFKWGSKKEAPSTIPTPSREKVTLQRSQRHPHHPSMFVGGVPQQVARPPSSHQDRDQDYHPSQRDDMLHSRASNLDQAKLDELMTRQKLLEDRINQLKMERDQLMEANNQPPPQPQPLPLKPHHEAAQPPRHISYVPTTVQPLRIPSNPPARVPDLRHSHSMSSAVHARQMAEPLDLPIQFPLPPQQPQSQYLQPLNSTSPGRGRSARAFPSSKHIQPLKTMPMAIPSAIRQDPAATSIHYASRPLPQPPIDATPPPEYEPPEQSYGRQYRDMKVKIASPNSGMVITQEVILEEPIPNPDDEKYPGSPRDDIDAEDILGWFETLKFASTGPRGRGPMAPLPRPEAGDIKIAPRGGEKSPAPESATTGYFDVKLPIHTQKQHATFDVGGARKDWNTGRKKRSEPKLRDYREDMRLAAV
ncbi:hypothetical protein TWF706_006157 [Orbilia oligospora]|nr:hypothetical protein TWF706_006157 [Orbilia oligospora]